MRKPALMLVLAGLVGALIATPIAVYASHRFDDVADSNTFHEDIAWLREAGVTRGCNPPANTEFCPKDEVTREQNAAFLRRLAENRVVDAGELAGRTVQELAPRATSVSVNHQGTDVGLRDFATTTIDAPAAGLLIANGVLSLGSDTTSRGACWVEAREPGADPADFIDLGGGTYTMDPTTDVFEECNTSGARVVPAGSYQISLWADCISAEGCPRAWTGRVWAIWIPFDGQGNTPAS